MGTRWLVGTAALVIVGVAAGREKPRIASMGKEAAWAATAREVHARFKGTPGTFAQFGDSITVSMAFWAPLAGERRNAPPEMERAFALVSKEMRPECWREWKGAEFGSEGGKTVAWALENLEGWLARLKPEVAVVMFGTNDLREVSVEEYRDRMRRLARRCIANGTVPMLTTIPPRAGMEAKSAQFAQAVREVAREMRLPLVDYHAEIMERRPRDWNGALPQFAAFGEYEAPTLLSRDGVHPSFPTKFQTDYSAEGLRSSGYTLRNYLTLLAYADVLRALRAGGRGDAERERRRDRETEGRGDGEARGQSRIPQAAPGQTTHRPADPTIPSRPWWPKAPPLPAPRGEVIRVSTVAELKEAVARVKPGGTIMVADGFYPIKGDIEITTDNVTLRGASGDRHRVILDGENQGELLKLTRCAGVTIAHLTVQNVRWNGIKLNTETGVHQTTIYDCALHNIWQRAVKGVLVPEEGRDRLAPREGRIQYCLFWNDRPKCYEDDPADTEENFGGNYIGGIDVMFPRGWRISDNVFVGIRGRTGSARGAVFLWHDARDCVVERNIIIDCDSGICLGNSHKPEGIAVHATGCIVRNNFLTRVPENGILADYTRDCRILHNTVHDPESRLGRLIRLVHENDGLIVANNLISGPPIRSESSSAMHLSHNVEQVMTDAFVAPAEGNLRLTTRATAAIDRALPLADVREDIDGRPRGAKPDVGAHELQR